MKKGIAFTLFVFVLFTGTTSIAGERRPIVAVFQIQDKDANLKKRTLRKLTEYLGTAISEGGVFRVVPPGDVRRALLQKKKDTYKQCYDQKCQIELGRELAANKTLSTSVLRIGKSCIVTSRLYDLKTQTTDVSAKAKGKCSEDGLMESIDKVAGEIRAWGSGGSAFKEEDLGEKPAGDWTVGGGREVIVRFESDPSGAVVLVDGNLVCQQTPCSKSVAIGTHTVAMQAPKYMKRQERKVLSEGGTITWELEPNFGWLTVYSEPSGLDVTVNGTKAGRTPIERSEREPGVYRVLVTSPCHYDEGKKVKVIRGKEREVSVGLKEKQGAVSVKAKDSKGNDVAADMYIDGRKVGRTPGTYKVSVCAKEMEVRHRKLGSAKKALSIRERRVTEVEVQLEIQLESSHEEVRQPGKNLYWLRCPIGHTWTEYSCQGRRKKMNWHKSMKACPSGYRLPTKQEFVDLLGDCTWTRGMGGSRGKCNSCLAVGSACSSMFGYDNYSYWTSSSYKKDLPKRSSHPLAPTRSMDLGLTVDFATGYVRSAGKLSETNVRCVRLSLKKREVATISGEMKSVRSEDGGVKWMFSRPADIEFTKSEITVAQYRACIEEGKCTEPKSKSDHNYCNWGYSGRDNYPVNCVDWFQAVDFCTWAGGRLPTEDEWYAEASNKGSRKYPWGDQKATCNYAVMREVGGFGCGRNSTWPVCSKAKGNSVSGLCDMSGNVWEWTSSSKGHSRVIRGGGWRMDDEKAGCLLASFRDSADPTWGHRYGFRCGRGVASSEKPNQHYILGCASCSTAGDTGNQPFTIFMLLVLGILIRRRQLRID